MVFSNLIVYNIHMIKKYISSIVLVAFVLLGGFSFAFASHSWNGYHWARTQNPFTLKLGDNVSTVWDAYLATSSTDWSASSVLDTTVVAGKTNPRVCRAVSGRVEVCNASYGNNGWLGIAQISILNSHILLGTVKLNDTYFNTAGYNTPEWRNAVMCQEIGHTLGLSHVDEDFGNVPLGTCMDYSADPTLNQHPNQHDYDMLSAIYAHLDSSTTIKAGTASATATEGGEAPSEWGRAVAQDAQGRNSLYEGTLADGKKLVTFVIWAK